MLNRNILPWIEEALLDSPVVLLNGARQTGKSTLAKSIAISSGSEYVTLDDLTTLSAVSRDPVQFLGAARGRMIIDEVQRVPDLLLAIKNSVDKDRSPGRFLLTGSAHFLMVPRLSESLAGRIDIQQLWPFSQGEIANHQEGFLSSVFSKGLPNDQTKLSLSETADLAIQGGFPEARLRKSAKRRQAWFDSYLTTILQRDVRDLASIDGTRDLPLLTRLIAARAGHIANYSELSRASGIAQTTLKRYLMLLKATFMVVEIPAWSANVSKRLVRSAKFYMVDSGLTAHLIGANRESLARDAQAAGPIIENFVATELLKQTSWHDHNISLFHFRTHAGAEVDFVLEKPDGTLVGIEVKSSSTIRKRDLRGLESLKESAGARFTRGIILYLGNEQVAFAPDIHAVPLGALWSW